MTPLEKNNICRTFRAVGHLGTLQTIKETKKNMFTTICNFDPDTFYTSKF